MKGWGKLRIFRQNISCGESNNHKGAEAGHSLMWVKE